MDLKKLIIAVITCGVLSFGAAAQRTYKLPKKHTQIADAQIWGNQSSSSPFAEISLKDVCGRSPFADMQSTSTSMNRSEELISATMGKASEMVDYARRFLGTRYRIGATGPTAFDCSGFVGYVFRNFGINLSRSSREQFHQGQKVTLNNLRPGDLLFFSSRTSGRGNVGHVAMVVSVDNAAGTCKFIHASVKKGVTYQTFPDNGYYSRNFIGAKRILGTSVDNNEIGSELADR